MDESSSRQDELPLSGDSTILRQYIKNLGLYFEEYNIPSIGGEILGLLSIANRPLSQEDLMDVLEVSRSSVSTNLRSLLMAGLVERVSVVGERSDAYVLSDDALSILLEIRIKKMGDLSEILEDGLSGLPEGHSARQRVQDMLDWARLLQTAYQDVIARWIARINNN
jgi:DNA-binding transcriptional regulator GbsR (MarR family)